MSKFTNSLFYGTVSVYYFPTEDDDEDGPTFKDKALEFILKCIDIFCVWDCCWVWLKFQEWVSFIVFDPFVELFITLCIVVNTMFMAMDHHNMNTELEKVLKSGNYVSIKYDILIFINLMNLVTVFYCHLCNRSYYETNGHESEILLSRGVEYI